MTLKKISAVVAFGLVLAACVSSRTALVEFSEELYWNPTVRSNRLTVIVFLVDGLSLPMLNESLRQHRAGAVERFFVGRGQKVNRGHTVFPSLTYPSISSLLTGQPVDVHSLVGNQMRVGSEIFNFESPSQKGKLNAWLQGQTVFQHLTDEGKKSISLDHYFRSGSTVHYRTDLEAGLDYLRGDYAAVDDKILGSLDQLLSGVALDEWPSFIFVHLVGVDALAHAHGPFSPQVTTYWERLNGRLEETFRLLRQAESRNKNLTAILTSDHGMTNVEKSFDVIHWAKSVDASIEALPQARFAGLYYPSSKAALVEARMRREIVARPELDFFAQRVDDEIRLVGSRMSGTIQYEAGECAYGPYTVKVSLNVRDSEEVLPVFESEEECPEKFISDTRFPDAPYLISGLASYFRAKEHASGVVIAAPRHTFYRDERGSHGGLSRDEVMVPILLHGAKIRYENAILPSFYLLRPLLGMAQ